MVSDLQSNISDLVSRLLAEGCTPSAIGVAVALFVTKSALITPDRSKHAICQANYLKRKKERATNKKNKDDHMLISADHNDHNPCIIVEATELMDNKVTLKQETPVKEITVRKTIMCEQKLDDWPENFGELFWQAYPKKNQKAKVISILTKIRAKGKVNWFDLMSGLARYSENLPEWQSWCWPTKWLNEERWNSNPAEEGTNGRKRSRSPVIQAADGLLDTFPNFDEGIAGKAEIRRTEGETDVRLLSHRGG